MALCRIIVPLLLAGFAKSESLLDRAEALVHEYQSGKAGSRPFGVRIGYVAASTEGCATSCAVLSQLFPDQVDFPGQAAFTTNQLGYWSEQQQTQRPSCRFNPNQTDQVAATVVVNKLTQCPFAVKSGGHASFYNASNIENGVAIDLRDLNSIVVTEDRQTTRVGAGARWQDVYQTVVPKGLIVIGGRNGDIGVGGLTLGGGISFFSGFHGWALDNVRNYELVAADGRVLNVNQNSHPALYFALRGGGNNFGIVTRLDLETYEHGDLWGGFTFYPPTANRSLYEAFYWFNYNSATDPKAALIVAMSYLQGTGFIMANNYEYIDPVPYPPVFSNFTAVQNYSDTQRVTNLTDLTTELAATQPSGLRQIFITLTLKNDANILSDILEIFTEELQPILNISTFLPSLVFQPLQLAVLRNFDKNGGNCLGLRESDGPLTIMNINFTWGDEEDDEAAQGVAQTIVERATVLAQSRGLYHPYKYQNYAYITQDVFSSYGVRNKNRLLRISKRWDPDGVFQKLQPGYFKLPF